MNSKINNNKTKLDVIEKKLDSIDNKIKKLSDKKETENYFSRFNSLS